MIIMIHPPQPLRDLEEAWLAASPRGPHTLRAYRTELDRLARFLRSCGRDGAELDPGLLERFWRDLTRGVWHETRKPPSKSTLDQSRRILSAFVRWLVAQERVPVTLLTTVAAWHTPARKPSAAEGKGKLSHGLPIARLLQVSDLDGAAAALCFWAGATPGELAALATVDVHPGRATVELVQRGIRRRVVLPRPLARSLKTLARAHQRWVFRVGVEPPTAAAMAQRVSRWLTQHGDGEVTSARSLRAQFQRHARANGWNSDEIRCQVRRPSLSPPPWAAPSHRRLAALIPSSSSHSP